MNHVFQIHTKFLQPAVQLLQTSTRYFSLVQANLPGKELVTHHSVHLVSQREITEPKIPQGPSTARTVEHTKHQVPMEEA